jgi:predicted ATPase/DNA-binding winged helix-turn-helix (wHTH) protein
MDGEPARLGARAFDVLAALIERRERLVSKTELLGVVWPHLVVEENNLQVQISALRKLLGSEVIATIPGRGYKFTAVLEDSQEAPAGQVAQTTAASTPPAAGTHGNLPAELAPLYGREVDVRAVQRQVQEHRLVTVAGAGGIGKTRVGLAVAHELRETFANGAWVIELAPLADPALVAASVAQVLGHQLRSMSAPLAELVALLESQRLLLLIDNCEHLVDAVSQLAQAVLDKAVGVHMLVTTQEPLRLPHERLYRLDTLGVPRDDEAMSAAQALEHGAVRLFVERARALDPRFALNESNVQAATDVCKQLDGLALAIEMAAARVPALGVQGVRERLGERLRMLTAGSRIALRRHQTLRAALDWSHRLLEEQDQVVFRRLGIFSGGCTIEAAQHVVADERLDEWAVLDAIGRLVDKSLIIADGDDKPRYRMLESARAYALEKLAAAHETDAMAGRHAACYAAHAERIGNALFAAGGTEGAFVAARTAEFDNFRAALKWALGEPGDIDIALDLLGNSSPFGWLAVSRAESDAWLADLTRVLARFELSPRQVALGCATEVSWGFMAAWHSSAGSYWRRPWHAVRQALRPLGERWTAYCASYWALMNAWRGDLSGARVVLDEARGLEQADWPAWLPATLLYNAVRVFDMTGESEVELGELAAMLARLHREGDSRGRAAFTIELRMAEKCLRDECYEEAIERLLCLADQGRREQRDPVTMVLLFRSLLLALIETGRLDQARVMILDSVPKVRWFGFNINHAAVLALFAARRGRLDTAARLLAAVEVRRAHVGGRLEFMGRHAERKVRCLLSTAHSDDELKAWADDGVALSDEEFDRLVIEET